MLVLTLFNAVPVIAGGSLVGVIILKAFGVG